MVCADRKVQEARMLLTTARERQERLVTAGMYAPSRYEDLSSAWTEAPTALSGAVWLEGAFM